MQFITDQQVREHITMAEAIEVMHDCFLAHSQGQGSILGRARCSLNNQYLSVMGGILANQAGESVMAAKIYPTIRGQFNFIIPLFAAETGQLLSVLEGNALTGLRTAAVTRVVFDQLYTGKERALGILGTGIQAQAHARALLPNSTFTKVLVYGIEGAEGFAQSIETEFSVPTRAVSLEEIHGADALVTATRSAEPLLRADLLQSNALIAAIGSSKPNTRELGEDCMRQAQHVIVEWKEQTFREAGEFALLQELTPIVNKTVEIGEVLRSPTQYRTGIRIYKSVGVGIEDVALAHYIHQKLNR